MLIDQIQHPHRPSIVGSGAHEVVAPDMVGTLRAQPYARPIVEPQAPSWLLLLRYLQPFATPDALDSILAHLPAGSLEQRRDPAISITAILTGKRNDRLSQSIFVFTLCRPVALRAPGLPQQKARMPLTDSMLTGMDYRTTPSFRA